MSADASGLAKKINVLSSSTSVWQSVTVSAPSETSATGNVFVAKSSETFGYDLDGNLTNDGRFSFVWDAENRLILVQSLTNSPQASWRKVTWEFDGKGRRIRQTSYDGSSGSYAVTDDLKFLADGWRHVAELNATNNVLVRSYLWGLDLSGTIARAGGIGGLILMNSVANGVHFATYDGNGNVAGLVKASDGTVSANYEYGPFGETLRATGAEAREIPFRFSTKRTDNCTDLLLYESRTYAPGLGRWLSRDASGQEGGPALYAQSEGDVINRFDPVGESPSGLQYSSEGQAQRDPWYWSYWLSWDSGRSASPDAYTFQIVYNFWPTSGGICNSGTRYPPHVGTFAEGWAKNTCSTRITTTVKCSVAYYVAGWAPSPTFMYFGLAYRSPKGELRSRLLGETLPAHFKSANATSLHLLAAETRTKTITVEPGQRFHLYDINPTASGFAGVQGMFFEALTVDCKEVN